MHFRVGVDARGVEFMLGSCGDSRLSYTVIDFNQVCVCVYTLEQRRLLTVYLHLCVHSYFIGSRLAEGELCLAACRGVL